jgi:hypothetical protein
MGISPGLKWSNFERAGWSYLVLTAPVIWNRNSPKRVRVTR